MATMYHWITGKHFYYYVADPNQGVNKLYRIQHPIYHHDLRPNVDLAASWGPLRYKINTNSLGFKDEKARNVPLKSDKHRLLFIGDSVTEGVGFSYQDTFPGLIGNALSSQDIEVFNAGVSSYAPSIYFAKVRYLIEQVGFDFDELIVFLDISDVDDEAHAYRTNEIGAVTGDDIDGSNASQGKQKLGMVKSWFRKNSILYAIPRMIKIRRKFSHVPDDIGEQFLMHYKRAMWSVDDKLFKSWGQEGLEQMIERMNQLSELLQKHNIKMTVAVYPWPTQIYYKDLDSIQTRTWKEWSLKKGVQFIDMFPHFVTLNDVTNKKNILQYFIPNDMHFNKMGHTMVADKFLSHYNSRASNQIENPNDGGNP